MLNPFAIVSQFSLNTKPRMAHIQLYRRQNGAYILVCIPFEGGIYYDTFRHRVSMDGQAYHPDDIPELVVGNLSWGIIWSYISLHWRFVSKKDQEKRKQNVAA